MAIRVLTDAYVSWHSVDLSDHVTSVTLNYEAAAVPTTAMGATSEANTGGLLSWDATIEFNNDEASSSVAQTLFADMGTTQTLLIRPDKSEGVGATNPNYTGTGVLVSCPMLAGSVGDLSKTTARIVCATALSRATS